jgi:hypothetical protein
MFTIAAMDITLASLKLLHGGERAVSDGNSEPEIVRMAIRSDLIPRAASSGQKSFQADIEAIRGRTAQAQFDPHDCCAKAQPL